MNQLWREYLRCVKAARPAVFVVENVPEFLTSEQFDDFLRACESDSFLKRYRIEHSVLAAHDFGVPQVRKRAIITGSRVGPIAFPTPTHGPTARTPYATLRDAIGDLPRKPTDADMHWRRNPTSVSLERYKAVPEGGNRFDLARGRPDLLPACWRNKPSGTTDVFGRLRWDSPASTIRTEFFKPEKGRYLHPSAHRPITHREAARLQTFPDDFVFEGSKTEIARQIGNAVPPKLAEAVARSVLATLRAGGR
jgi:DNA (cytosine-5)-methyltransferase 1